MTGNEKKYEQAKTAISELHSDLSVSPQKALENMNGLRDEIDINIACLEEDIRLQESDDD